MRRRTGGSLTLAALVLAGAGTSCRTAELSRASSGAQAIVRLPENPAPPGPEQRIFSAWEQSARDEADGRLDEAQNRADAGEPADAEACVDDALRILLDAPVGYPSGHAYLDYLAAVLDEAERLGGALAKLDAATADQDVSLVPSFDVPDENHTGEDALGPTLPKSDYPLVVNSAVETFLDAFTRPGEYRHRIVVGLSRAGHYLPMIRAHLETAGLPEDLAYLPLIESAYSETATSRARAQGMWQFIAGTARQYGLAVNALVDERNDAERATQAAAAHLGDLYAEFGDWNLALAAYNSGAGNVRRAVHRAGSTDFWSLRQYLPRETRNYVPAFIAAVLAVKAPSRYGLPEVGESAWQYDNVEVPDALDLDVLARGLDLGPEDLRRLNPALRKGLTPAGTVTRLRVPTGSGVRASAVLARLPRDQWAPRTLHAVRSGESLSVIARRYGSSIEAIRVANGLRGSLIRPGQSLVVPRFGSAAGSHTESASRSLASDGSYVVRSGDNLWAISRSFGVGVEVLRAANGLDLQSEIRPGQRLRVPTAGKMGRAQIVDRAAPQTYRVRPGDTLFEIARRFGTTVRELRRSNELTGTIIQPGDLLRIPSPRGA